MPVVAGVSRFPALASPARYAAVAILAALSGAGVSYSLFSRGPAPRPVERPAPVTGAAHAPPRHAPAEVGAPGAGAPPVVGATAAAPPAEQEIPPGDDERPSEARASADPPPARLVGTQALKPRRININTASQAELELLPGVGPSLAKRIIEYRSLHGRFVSVADLDKVRGIGPKTLERLAPLVTVD